MADHLGFYNTATTRTTVRFAFTTHNAAGATVAPSSPLESGDLLIYKDGSATQRTSANGITMTSPFDSITGLHHVSIDLTDNTDAGFWASGSWYMVVLSPDETVDSQTVAKVLAYFEIGPPPGDGTAQMTESYAADGVAPTRDQALFMILGYLFERNLSGNTISCYKLDGSTVWGTFTIDSATTTTSQTRAT